MVNRCWALAHLMSVWIATIVITGCIDRIITMRRLASTICWMQLTRNEATLLIFKICSNIDSIQYRRTILIYSINKMKISCRKNRSRGSRIKLSRNTDQEGEAPLFYLTPSSPPTRLTGVTPTTITIPHLSTKTAITISLLPKMRQYPGQEYPKCQNLLIRLKNSNFSGNPKRIQSIQCMRDCQLNRIWISRTKIALLVT